MAIEQELLAVPHEVTQYCKWQWTKLQ